MAKNLMKQILITLFALAAAAGPAAAELSQYEIDANAAKAYSDAYAVRDKDALFALLADDAVFKDPANYHEGKDAIVEGFSKGLEKITSNGPDGREIRKFRSGNDFIFAAFIDFNMLRPISESEEREFNFKVDFLMVLTVKDGKIIKHIDYVDTEAFVAQLQQQMAEASAE